MKQVKGPNMGLLLKYETVPRENSREIRKACVAGLWVVNESSGPESGDMGKGILVLSSI